MVFLWRTTEKVNIKTFIHEGPRRAAKGHEEGQGQHLFVREGARRVAKNGNCNGKTFFHGGHGGPRRRSTSEPLSTKGHEGPRRRSRATPFCPRRGAKNCDCNIFCPRRAAKNGFCTFLSWVGWVGCGGRVVWDVGLRAFYLTFGRDSFIVMVLPARCGRGRYRLGL